MDSWLLQYSILVIYSTCHVMGNGRTQTSVHSNCVHRTTKVSAVLLCNFSNSPKFLKSNNIPFPAAFCQFNSLDSCGKDTSRTLELGRFSVCLIIVPFCGLQTHCVWISINDKALSLKGTGKAILSIISSKKILSVQKHLASRLNFS